MRSSGTSVLSASFATSSSTFPVRTPCRRAASLARWITGPSPRGSEKGSPTSKRSASSASGPIGVQRQKQQRQRQQRQLPLR